MTLDEGGLLIRLLAVSSLVRLADEAHRRHILLLSFTHLASTAITNQHKLEGGCLLRHAVCVVWGVVVGLLLDL